MFERRRGKSSSGDKSATAGSGDGMTGSTIRVRKASGQAAQQGVAAGDTLVSVNGQEVGANDRVSDVVQRVKGASRPLKMVFAKVLPAATPS